LQPRSDGVRGGVLGIDDHGRCLRTNRHRLQPRGRSPAGGCWREDTLPDPTPGTGRFPPPERTWDAGRRAHRDRVRGALVGARVRGQPAGVSPSANGGQGAQGPGGWRRGQRAWHHRGPSRHEAFGVETARRQVPALGADAGQPRFVRPPPLYRIARGPSVSGTAAGTPRVRPDPRRIPAARGRRLLRADADHQGSERVATSIPVRQARCLMGPIRPARRARRVAAATGTR